MSNISNSDKIHSLVVKSPLVKYLHENYPILNEIANFWLSFGILNTLIGILSGLINQFKEINATYFPFINQFINFVENSTIKWVFINFIDRFIPSLKSLHLSDLKFNNIYSSLIKNLKSSIVYKKSEEITTSIFKIINSKLSGLTKQTEEIKSDTSDQLSLELTKFTKLSKNVIENVVSYPTEVSNHVKKVYKDEFSKNNNNSIKAIASTSNELASNLTQKVSKGFKKLSNNETIAEIPSVISSGVNGNVASTSVEVTPSNINGEISVGG